MLRIPEFGMSAESYREQGASPIYKWINACFTGLLAYVGWIRMIRSGCGNFDCRA